MKKKETTIQDLKKKDEFTLIEHILKKNIKEEKSSEVPNEDEFEQPYGSVVSFAKPGLIRDSTGSNILKSIVNEYLTLLETSSAVYEKNGDYALGIFSSGWCRLLDNASREICNTGDNIEALKSGRWHCHESCWKVSKDAMETAKPADIECNGGIRLYAVPIMANGEVVGSINFGYGDPPKDDIKIKEISNLYDIDIEKLNLFRKQYVSRPNYIINLAKHRLKFVAKLIGVTAENKIAENRAKHLASFPQYNANPIIETDLSGNIIFHNNAALEAVRKHAHKDDVTLFLPSDLHELLKDFDEQKKPQVKREIKIGTRIYEEHLHFVKEFRLVGIYIRDITEQRISEKMVEENEKWFRAIFDQASIGVGPNRNKNW